MSLADLKGVTRKITGALNVGETLQHIPRLSERYFFGRGRSTLHTAIGICQRTLRNLFERQEYLTDTPTDSGRLLRQNSS
jgi:hypothetical protein